MRVDMSALPKGHRTCTARFQDKAAAWDKCQTRGACRGRRILRAKETGNPRTVCNWMSGASQPAPRKRLAARRSGNKIIQNSAKGACHSGAARRRPAFLMHCLTCRSLSLAHWRPSS
eukprot:3750114-Pyramimonas_sp.AAC.1